MVVEQGESLPAREKENTMSTRKNQSEWVNVTPQPKRSTTKVSAPMYHLGAGCTFYKGGVVGTPVESGIVADEVKAGPPYPHVCMRCAKVAGLITKPAPAPKAVAA
jgi:hypothetical protein